MSNMLLPQDKATHCVVGAIVFIFCAFVLKHFAFLAPDIGAAIAVFLGAGLWEVVRKLKYGYAPDPHDVLWSMGGPALCMLARAV